MSLACVPPPAGRPAALGGHIRLEPADFQVEEIPLFQPTGRGEFTVFQVEKEGLSTLDVILRVSKGVKVSENGIGYAGLKDARARTRQRMSVRRVDPERLLALRHPRFRVLSAARHPTAVKLGHHRGNRFTIRVRGVRPERVPAARAALQRLAREGMPNGYGAQRFGTRLDGHVLGRAIVEEDWDGFVAQLLGRPSPLEGNPRIRAAREAFEGGDLRRAQALFPIRHRAEKRALAALLRTGRPLQAFLAVGRRARRIWIAAWQAHVFNRVLARRLAEGTWNRLLPGDVASLAGSGALVPAREEDVAGRTSARPTGPIVGHDLRLAEAAPGEIERAVLAEERVDLPRHAADHVRARGQRRPLVVPVREASLVRDGAADVVVRFVLPSGAFATVLLDHLMRGGDAVPDHG